MPQRTVRRHEEVLVLQSHGQAELRPALEIGGRGLQLNVKLLTSLGMKNLLLKMLLEVHDFSVDLCFTFPHLCLPLQAKPMEVQATRDFDEPRKLALVANDLVTVIDHGWVRERRAGLK